MTVLLDVCNSMDTRFDAESVAVTDVCLASGWYLCSSDQRSCPCFRENYSGFSPGKG
ncbi:hypothetical protein JW905_18085 [bacterium]|nr:hypothetical protein [candidate division CSSED10-310 bacterium]